MAIVTLEEILSIWFNTLSKELEPLYTKSISLSTADSIKALKSFVGVIIYESYLNSNNASATS